jgi:ATP-dependent DNA helicase PIF1
MPDSLANGTRLIVVKLMQHIIDAEIATGPDKGRRVFIARLNITPSNTERMSFTLHRQQFPLQPTFAMTINKAQGQTLQIVGVYLPKPFFATGSFMWLSLGVVHGGASGCWSGVTAGRL